MSRGKSEKRFFVTKYALTKGIIEVSGYQCGERMIEATKIVEDGTARECMMSIYFHGDDWHETRESAELRAYAMRRKKVESLKKQIIRLEKLCFFDIRNQEANKS